MKVRFSYQRFLTGLLIATMLWNVMGWVGLGILGAHLSEHTEGEHCDVTLCYCKVEDGDKICECHHPKLHALMNQKADAPEVDSMEHMAHHSYCFYTKGHNSPLQSDKVIMISEFQSILPYYKVLFKNNSIPETLSVYDAFLSEGYVKQLLRPPSI